MINKSITISVCILFLFASCTFELKGKYVDGGSNCIDNDEDGHGEGCELGNDCDDNNMYAWENCATCKDSDEDGYYSGTCDLQPSIPDCDDATPKCNEDCSDKDGDRIPDCKDSCVDQDHDSHGIGECQEGVDFCDNDPLNWTQDGCRNCIDQDGDHYFVGCDSYDESNPGPDCDDNSPQCNTNCSDSDRDGIKDCVDLCIDQDRDNYGIGEGCIGVDCDDTLPECTTDCSNIDNDNLIDCIDLCIDRDGDNYGEGSGCRGRDCDDNIASCNINCTEDTDRDGEPNCRDNCLDIDDDGYGNYALCNQAPTLCERCINVNGSFLYDCNDSTNSIHPGAEERCGEALDHNCDGIVDELKGCPQWQCQIDSVSFEGGYNTGGSLGRAVFIEGERVYLAVDQTIWILNKTDLSPLASISIDNGEPSKLFVINSIIYVADNINGLVVIDARDVQNLRIVYTERTREGHSLYLDSSLFLNDPSNPLYLYIAKVNSGVKKFRIENKLLYSNSLNQNELQPTDITQYQPRNFTIYDVITENNVSIIIGSKGQEDNPYIPIPYIEVLDITNPNNIISSFQHSTNNSYYWGSFKRGGYLYVTTPQELTIFEINNNNQIYYSSSRTSPDPSPNFYRLFIHGNYAFIASIHNKLRIVDISSPSNPSILNINIPSELNSVYVNDVFVVNNKIYLATSSSNNQQNDIFVLNIECASSN